MADLDRAIEYQLERIGKIAGEAADAGAALVGMVRQHLKFAIEGPGTHLASWRDEFRDLPAEDAWRLRRLQRLYVEEWVHVLGEVRPDLSDGEARTAVHATMALLQSAGEHNSGLEVGALTEVLASMALAALGAAPERQGVL